jgi:hypothetical protein
LGSQKGFNFSDIPKWKVACKMFVSLNIKLHFFSGQKYPKSKILIIKSQKNVQLLDTNKVEKLQSDKVITYLFERKLGNGKLANLIIEYDIERQKFDLP